MSEPSRPNDIPGYQPPTQYNYNRGSTYKTFSDKKPKEGKKEIFGSVTKGNNYESHKYENEEEKCPTCKEKVVYVCSCSYNDKRCKNAHIWYTTRDGKIKKGNPH